MKITGLYHSTHAEHLNLNYRHFFSAYSQCSSHSEPDLVTCLHQALHSFPSHSEHKIKSLQWLARPHTAWLPLNLWHRFLPPSLFLPYLDSLPSLFLLPGTTFLLYLVLLQYFFKSHTMFSDLSSLPLQLVNSRRTHIAVWFRPCSNSAPRSVSTWWAFSIGFWNNWTSVHCRD